MLKKINARTGKLLSPSLPWKEIKEDFVKGFRTIDGHVWPNYEELARKYNTTQSAISNKANSGKDKWLPQQQMYMEKFNQLYLNEQGNNLVKESAEFDKQCFDIATTAIGRVQEELERDLSDGETELGRLSRTGHVLATFQKIGMEALGIAKRDGGPTTQYNIVSFSQGIDSVMKQIRSNPEILKNKETEIVDV